MSVYDQHYNKMLRNLNAIGSKAHMTIGELLFFGSFVINFILGKLVHVLSPPLGVYNYYNNKHNFINQIFVKRGWGWTTLYIAAFYAILYHKKRVSSQRLAQAGIRWAIVTLWWWLFTQWCFGVPIMDKVFLLTGGKCYVELDQVKGFEGVRHLFAADFGRHWLDNVSSYQCRQLRGVWEGGHDPLGHVFLMVHALCFMFLEGKAFWPGWNEVVRSIREKFGGGVTVEAVKSIVTENPHVVLMQLIGLWWFMLFMTNIYFHLLFEKFVGLIFGFAGIYVVYLARRERRDGKEKGKEESVSKKRE